MLEYRPLIKALEGPNADIVRMSSKDSNKSYLEDIDSYPSVVQQFIRDCHEKFGEVPYLGGLKDLRVATVSGRVRINEYDGSESIEEEHDYKGWM